MDTTSIIALITAIISAPLSSWLTNILLRKKYKAEVEQLKAQIDGKKAETRSDELENVKKAMSILMEQVVEPLKKEINEIRKELVRLRKALGKVNDCTHRDACPVRNELCKQETGEHIRIPS